MLGITIYLSTMTNFVMSIDQLIDARMLALQPALDIILFVIIQFVAKRRESNHDAIAAPCCHLQSGGVHSGSGSISDTRKEIFFISSRGFVFFFVRLQYDCLEIFIQSISLIYCDKSITLFDS